MKDCARYVKSVLRRDGGRDAAQNFSLPDGLDQVLFPEILALEHLFLVQLRALVVPALVQFFQPSVYAVYGISALGDVSDPQVILRVHQSVHRGLVYAGGDTLIAHVFQKMFLVHLPAVV